MHFCGFQEYYLCLFWTATATVYYSVVITFRFSSDRFWLQWFRRPLQFTGKKKFEFWTRHLAGFFQYISTSCESKQTRWLLRWKTWTILAFGVCLSAPFSQSVQTLGESTQIRRLFFTFFFLSPSNIQTRIIFWVVLPKPQCVKLLRPKNKHVDAKIVDFVFDWILFTSRSLPFSSFHLHRI